MYGKNDNFDIVNAKIEPSMTRALDAKIDEAKKKGMIFSRSEVIRELLRQFINGDIKITKTIGG